MKQQFLEAGQIVNTHGIKGEVRIMPWADDAQFLKKFKTFYIDNQPVRVVHSRVHKNMLIAQLDGINDINAAMPLKNKVIKIDRNDAKLPKGSFFIQDIMGASVVDEAGQEVGKLTDVLDLPRGQVYEVTGATTHLIPAVPEFVLDVDAEQGRIVVRLIEGM